MHFAKRCDSKTVEQPLYLHIALLSVAVLAKENVSISQVAEGSSLGSVVIEVCCYVETLWSVCVSVRVCA